MVLMGFTEVELDVEMDAPEGLSRLHGLSRILKRKQWSYNGNYRGVFVGGGAVCDIEIWLTTRYLMQLFFLRFPALIDR
jgi:hypothetical protein